MIIRDESSIRSHIKAGKLARLYFIYGDEGYLAAHYASNLASSVTDTSGAGFNYHYFDSETVTFDAVYEACETLPVMSDKVCIFIKDFPFLKTGADELKNYTDYFPKLPDTAVVIFLMETTEIDPKQNAKWQGILDEFDKNGVIFRLSKRSENDITALLVRSAGKRNASITNETAAYFLSIVGSDMNVLLNEFDKLCAYANGREITTDMIDAVSVKSVEASVFDLTDAVNRGKNDRAFAILSALIKEKTDPTLIIGTIAFSYVDMYRMKAAGNERGSVRAYLDAYAGYKNKPYRLEKAATAAKSVSMTKLKRILDAVSEADIKIKSFSMDNNVILEELLAKLLYIMESAA